MATKAENRFYGRKKILDDVPRRRDVAPHKFGDTRLRAAAQLVDLTPAFGLRMGGFGPFKGKPARFMFGRLFATVLLLDDGDGHRVLLIVCDLHAGIRYITEHVAARLAAPLGLKIEDVWITASHCHSGPGHIYAEHFYDYYTTAFHGFDKATVDRFINLLVNAAESLGPMLTPARLGAGSAVVWDLFWNRSVLATLSNSAPHPTAKNAGVRKPLSVQEVDYGRTLAQRLSDVLPRAFQVNPKDLDDISEKLGRSAVDPRVRVLHVVKDDAEAAPIATIALMHATPTVIRPEVRCMTGDVAAFAAALVRVDYGKNYPINVAAGAMADVNVVDPSQSIQEFRQAPKDEPEPVAVLKILYNTAEELATALRAAIAEASAAATNHLPIKTRMGEWLVAAAPLADGHHLADAIEVGKKTFAGSELLRRLSKDAVAFFEESSYDKFKAGKPLARNGLDQPQDPKGTFGDDLIVALASQIGSRFTGAHRVMTPWAQLRTLRLGDIVLVGWPVEPTMGIYEQLRHHIAPQLSTPERFFFFGLTSGYLGYATTVMEYRIQDYEGASTFWGRRFGDWLVEKTGELLTAPLQPKVRDKAEFRTRDVNETPMNVLDRGYGKSLVPNSSGRELIIEDDRIGGRWMSDDPDEDAGRRPLGDDGHGPIIELTLDGQTWMHRGLEINDVNFPFMLRRQRTKNRKKVRWTAYMLRTLLPKLTVQQLGTLNFRVLAKGMFEELSP